VIAKIDRRNDQGKDDRKAKPEELHRMTATVIEHDENDGGVPARKRIPLVFLELIQSSANGLREGAAFQRKSLDVLQRIPGTDGGEKQIPDVGKKESENDAEGRLVERPPIPSLIKNDDEHDRQEIIGGVCELEEINDQGIEKPLQPDSGIRAEEPPVGVDEC
jgi:hypothetical protein